jgi:hypothetical protein
VQNFPLLDAIPAVLFRQAPVSVMVQRITAAAHYGCQAVRSIYPGTGNGP